MDLDDFLVVKFIDVMHGRLSATVEFAMKCLLIVKIIRLIIAESFFHVSYFVALKFLNNVKRDV
jgi:hypothetical protein